MKLLTNHLGYGSRLPKKAVFQCRQPASAGEFRVVRAFDGQCVCAGRAVQWDPVANWHTGRCWTLDFSELSAEGVYYIELDTESGAVRSGQFEVRDFLLDLRMISAVGYYLKAQRSSGEWLHRDRCIPFAGPRAGTADVHGGWYDATGDYGIHLSHLSHSTYHNPQQASFTAAVLFRLGRLLEQYGNEQFSMVKRRLLDEAFFGADFLMRMRAPSGSFFRSISRGDAFGVVERERVIGFEYRQSSAQFGQAATAGSETVDDENYEVSLRSGGGYAIAALALAGRHHYPGAGHGQAEYVAAAKAAWAHLEKNNEKYTNDGRWNLVDEYCALDALVDLYQATGEYDYLRQARAMAARVMVRIVEKPGGTAWFDMDEGLPFHHAADEGLPVVALLNYRAIEPDCALKGRALAAAEKTMGFALAITQEAPNPFGYARMHYRDNDTGACRTGFFFPHNSNAKPWWQGDNARIASLATAALQLAGQTGDAALASSLKRYAASQTDWIMGLNPFDSCMMEGYGRNNIQYFFNGRYDFINCPGGICNGITGGLDGEGGIAFVTEPGGSVSDNWRWAEQWLPHATWFLYAMASGCAVRQGQSG